VADRFFGAHTIDHGGIHMAVRRAASAGMRALQVFTAVPSYYNEKMSVRPERVERFRSALAESGILPRHVLAHAAYVLSVATPDDAKYARASAGLAKEVERATQLGIGAVCFHPGSAMEGTRTDACSRVGRAITQALRTVESPTRLLIENTAGAGNTMGRTADEIAEMLGHVPAELRPRTGYGLDTCHLFASGLDVSASPDAQRAILDEFERAIGEPPAFFHLNDSAGALGSNRDRHTLLGEGRIGSEPFRWLVRDPRTANVPCVLETPQERLDIAEDDASADPFDLRMMALLESFEA
jgi:deoxyribonuclease-4